MPKATLTVVLEDGNSTTREMSWTDEETPSAEDCAWIHAEITSAHNEKSN